MANSRQNTDDWENPPTPFQRREVPRLACAPRPFRLTASNCNSGGAITVAHSQTGEPATKKTRIIGGDPIFFGYEGHHQAAPETVSAGTSKNKSSRHSMLRSIASLRITAISSDDNGVPFSQRDTEDCPTPIRFENSDWDIPNTFTRICLIGSINRNYPLMDNYASYLCTNGFHLPKQINYYGDMRMQEKALAITSHPEWNQTKLAHVVGSAQSTVQRWVTGESEPSGENRDELNRIYDELFPKENAATIVNLKPHNSSSTNTLLSVIQRVDEVIANNRLELSDEERWEVINNELDRINDLRTPIHKK